jgi:hypothetical protein
MHRYTYWWTTVSVKLFDYPSVLFCYRSSFKKCRGRCVPLITHSMKTYVQEEILAHDFVPLALDGVSGQLPAPCRCIAGTI